MTSFSAMPTRLLASVFVLLIYVGENSSAQAKTFVYDLDGTLAEKHGGPSLVAYGGTLGPTGYYFGPNMGLSLSGTGIFDAYSIDIRFYFDSVNASFDGFQRILDYENRAVDMGLYSYYGALRCFRCPGPNSSQVFFDHQLVDLRTSRDASGLANHYINGNLVYSGVDSSNLLTFTGPNKIIYFFIDDFQSLATHPTQLEAGSGFIDSITVQVFPSAVPEPSTWAMMLVGFVGLGFVASRRRAWGFLPRA